MKNILLLGSSSLEDTIAWKLNQENTVNAIFISPGNAGYFSKPKARNIELDLSNKNEIKNFLTKEKISYVIASSFKNLTFEFEQILSDINIPLIGPSKKLHYFFNSRINIKNFLSKYSIPSNYFQIVDSFESLKEIIENVSSRKLIYFDSQPGFKGSFLLESKGQGSKIIVSIKLKLKTNSEKFLIENHQKGEEYSAVIAFDTVNYILFPIVRIYPKSFDNDYGLFTSGMGGLSPCPGFNNNDIINLNEKIIFPLIEGLKSENLQFQGFLTINFIKSNDKLIVLNIIPTISSPEIETISGLINSSFNNLCIDMISKNLLKYALKISPFYSVSIVLASKGYPLDFEKGVLIAGLEKDIDNINIFHNKTALIKYSKNRGFVTSGGRVVTINAVRNTLDLARNAVYEIIENNLIFFDGNFYRSDIAEKYCKKTMQI